MMWVIYWDDKQLLLDTVEKVMNTVDQLNKEYVEKQPILIRVENDLGDMMCMGIGHREEYSIIDFFPSESSSSKSVEGENAGPELFVLIWEDMNQSLLSVKPSNIKQPFIY